MSNYGACKDCKNPFADNDRYVVCEGFCRNSAYHTRCVGIIDDECDACCHANIFWMCDDCRDFMQSARCCALVNTMQAEGSRIERLNVEICELKSTVNSLIETVQLSHEEPAKSVAPYEEHRTIKRCSPLSSTRLDICSDAVTVMENHEFGTYTSKLSNERFKLFISNIANDVTEKEIEEMVGGIVGTNDSLVVKRLVPAWRDTSTLEYISFRVEMDASFKTAALTSKNWPANVRHREFNDYSNETWRPSNRSTNN